jgi:hypothetical protein
MILTVDKTTGDKNQVELRKLVGEYACFEATGVKKCYCLIGSLGLKQFGQQ